VSKFYRPYQQLHKESDIIQSTSDYMDRMVITRAAPVNLSQFYHESMGIHTFTINCFIHVYSFSVHPSMYLMM